MKPGNCDSLNRMEPSNLVKSVNSLLMICSYLKFCWLYIFESKFIVKKPNYFSRLTISKKILFFFEILVGKIRFIFLNNNTIYFKILRLVILFTMISGYLINDKNSALVINFSTKIHILSKICENESVPEGRSYYNQDIDIYDCFFTRHTSFSGEGGVIFVEGSYNSVIYNSMFYHISCGFDGGSVFLDCEKSNMNRVCAHCSTAAKSYHFAFISASQINRIEFLSISLCANSTHGSQSFSLYYGSQKLLNSNSSMNNAVDISGCCVMIPTDFKGIFCTFSNNNVSSHSILSLSRNTGVLSFINIVENSCPSLGVVYQFSGYYTLESCVMTGNNKILCYVHSGQMTLKSCAISHSHVTTLGAVTINDTLIPFIETYVIQFFHSRYCNADNTINILTPQETPMVTPKCSPNFNPMENDTQMMVFQVIGIATLVIGLLFGVAYTFQFLNCEDSSSSHSPVTKLHLLNKEG